MIKEESKSKTESRKTSVFTEKVISGMLREPTEVTKPFVEILKRDISMAIKTFFIRTGNCPKTCEIVSIVTSRITNRLIVNITVSGTYGNNAYSINYVSAWLGVHFDDSYNFTEIRGEKDARVCIAKSGEVFNATGDILFSSIYPYSAKRKKS